jgi:hypothetical protein
MPQLATKKGGHKKLIILLSIIALLASGFFVYKYTYIFLERRQYKTAEAAIAKVADDLRTQGIETAPFKNCEHAQVKYGEGFLTCQVGIIYKGSEEKIGVKEPLEKFIASIDKQGFGSTGSSDDPNPTGHPIITGTLSYILGESKQSCGLTYDKADDLSPPYTLDFGCSKSSRFALFPLEP